MVGHTRAKTGLVEMNIEQKLKRTDIISVPSCTSTHTRNCEPGLLLKLIKAFTLLMTPLGSRNIANAVMNLKLRACYPIYSEIHVKLCGGGSWRLVLIIRERAIVFLKFS